MSGGKPMGRISMRPAAPPSQVSVGTLIHSHSIQRVPLSPMVTVRERRLIASRLAA